MIALALACLVASSSPPAADGKTRVLVLDVANNGVDEVVVRTITSLVTVELAKHADLDVVSGDDVRRLAALESERQISGCTDTSCLAEIAGALGAERVVFGDAGKLGELIVVNLSLYDAAQAKAVARRSAETRTLEELPAALRPQIAALSAAARGAPIDEVATAAPLAPGWFVVGGGAALGAAGVVAGTVAAITYAHAVGETAMRASEIDRLREAHEAGDAGALGQATALQGEIDALPWNAWGALVGVAGAAAVVVGAAVVGAGAAWLMLPVE